MAVSKSCSFNIPEICCVISADLLEYFLSDEFFLPADAYPPSDEIDDGATAVPVDVGVEAAVKEALSRWDRVTIKVDDVAPSDSDWMMPFGDASCATLGHVYMAVKASNRIREHLETVRDRPVKLRIQKWIRHSPAGEFRCYTKGNRLTFAGQRYPVKKKKTVPIDETISQTERGRSTR